MANELHKHYGLLLGISSPWMVKQVDLQLPNKLVEIQLEWEPGQRTSCPDCGQACPMHDRAPERSWRHLDTMQFTTVLRARVPRADCPEHGIKTVRVDWADPHGRFTLFFERFALDVLLASASISQACELMGLSWDQAQHVMNRAVERGLSRRELDQLINLGLDEKSFGRGHEYVTVLVDLEGSRVLEVTPERTEEAAEKAWQTLSQTQRENIQAVAMDMWEPYRKSTEQNAPNAAIVHDRYHISAHLNKAVDEVRRAEHRELMAKGDETLKNSRQLWLYDPRNLTPEQQETFEELLQKELQVGQAWAGKELFTRLWEYKSQWAARRFFENWESWVEKSGMKPMKKVARMVRNHLENILTYLKHPITNAVTEGLNGKIQSVKAAARGFRNFANYRVRILFFCGKLDLYPL